jgi:DNA (cytosine-5)-methyltransferase 3A
MPKEAKEIITKELFGIEPVMINASLVSAQNRKRLFWIGKLVGDTYKQVKIEQPKDKGILLRDILEPKVDERYYIKEKSNTIRVSGRGSGINDRHNWDTIRIGQIGNGGQGDRIYSQKGKSVTLSANGGEGLINLKTQQIRKLTPIECERLQSLPDNYTEGVSNTQRYKALGNGFNCEVIKHILTNLT